jgi:hypothetical protein
MAKKMPIKAPPLTIRTFKHEKKEASLNVEGKSKACLPNELTRDEKIQLSKAVREYTQQLEKQIEDEYPDNYKTTQMMN